MEQVLSSARVALRAVRSAREMLFHIQSIQAGFQPPPQPSPSPCSPPPPQRAETGGSHRASLNLSRGSSGINPAGSGSAAPLPLLAAQQLQFLQNAQAQFLQQQQSLQQHHGLPAQTSHGGVPGGPLQAALQASQQPRQRQISDGSVGAAQNRLSPAQFVAHFVRFLVDDAVLVVAQASAHPVEPRRSGGVAQAGPGRVFARNARNASLQRARVARGIRRPGAGAAGSASQRTGCSAGWAPLMPCVSGAQLEDDVDEFEERSELTAHHQYAGSLDSAEAVRCGRADLGFVV